jgi:hypothetical protein
VLTTVKETVGFVTDDVIKASHGFSGGGLMELGACGTLTCGLIALSCKRGRDRDKFEFEGPLFMIYKIMPPLFPFFKNPLMQRRLFRCL